MRLAISDEIFISFQFHTIDFKFPIAQGVPNRVIPHPGKGYEPKDVGIPLFINL